MKRLKTGYIGWTFKDEAPECQTVAFCDIDVARMEKLAKEHPDVAMYTDYRDMLKHSDLDVVVISSPNYVHAEQALAFLDAGKHVFLEKPMGINREECNRVLDAQRRSGRNLTVDFELRVSPFARRIKCLIESGEYGELRRIEYLHHQGAWLENGNGIWRTRPEKSGGLLLECPIHYVDIFRFFAGEIESVQSTVGPNVLPHYHFEDNICSHFFFKNGILATMLNTHTHSAVPRDPREWSAAPDYLGLLGHEMSMIFTLTGGSLGVNFITARIMINRIEEWPRGSGGVRVVGERLEDWSRGPLFYHDSDAMRWEFIRRCANDLPPVQNAADIWKSHVVCLAAEQSAREDFRRVVVDYSLP